MSVELQNHRATVATGAVAISEIDGSPINSNISTLKFSNGSIVDNGDGSMSISTGAGGGGDASTDTTISVDGEVALFSGVGGKTLKRWTQTGLLKSSSGVLQVATSSTDYAPPTVGSSILMGDDAGGFTNAVAGTNYLAIDGNGSQLTGLTKSQVDLANVDNTSDLNKPISSSTQTALNLKAPLAGPSFTGNIRSTLLSTENILIDARTNPRTITLGVLRVNHTAGIEGTRPFTLDIDANGFGNTHALVVDYRASNVDVGENHLLEVNIDTTTSLGGEIKALSVSRSGNGLVNVTAVESLPGVKVISQKIGDPIILTQSWTLSGTNYVSVTSEFANGSDIEIFTNDNDYIICGYDTHFHQIEVLLSTKSSHTIDALFEYSTGTGTWLSFSPSDGTNGFTNNGTIMWQQNLPGWVSSVVNGVSKYYIRIQRTKNLITTPPIENNIRVVTSTNFGWDENGDLSIRKLSMIGTPIYTDNASALAAGLIAGQTYRTSVGVLMEVY